MTCIGSQDFAGHLPNRYRTLIAVVTRLDNGTATLVVFLTLFLFRHFAFTLSTGWWHPVYRNAELDYLV